MKKPYFTAPEGGPAPLTLTTERTIRFQEVDMLAIAWHGHYTSFFEDARVALGERYDMGYMDLADRGILAPIKTAHVDFIRPLKFRDRITIEGRLHYSEAARINTDYVIRDEENRVAATGYIVQMLLDKDFQLFLTPPPYVQAFLDRWKAGELP